jgi:hypothetical protein
MNASTPTETTHIEQHDLLVSDLQELARQGDALDIGQASLPILRAHVAINSEGATGVDEIHDLIESAIESLDTTERDAARILFGSTEERFRHNLRARRTDAGRLLGIRESTFRKKRKVDNRSKYDDLTHAVARAIEDVAPTSNIVDPEPGDTPSPMSSPWRRPARLSVALALVTAIAAGALVWTLAAASSDPPSNEATLPSPETGATSEPSAARPPPAQPGEPVEGCNIPVGAAFSPDPPSEQIAENARIVYGEFVDDIDLACPTALMTRWQRLWVQPIDATNGSKWQLVVDDEQPEFAFILSDLLFEGYFRIFDEPEGNGANAQGLAGYPREVDATGDVPYIRFDNGSLLIAENAQVMPRWLTPESVEEWESLGGADGALGLPITDGNFFDNVPRQEFQRGFGTITDGAIQTTIYTTTEIASGVAALPRQSEMILETFDRASWWIDENGRRHWIPDVDTYWCLGGDDAKIPGITAGWVVAAFEVDDAASCN